MLTGRPVQVFTGSEKGLSTITVEDAPAGAPTDWIGAYPWLTTDDGLTSHAYGVGGTGFPAKVGWLVDATPGLTGDLTVSTSSTYAAGSSTSVTIWVHDLAVLTAPGAGLVDDALAAGSTFSPDGSWTVRTATFAVTPEMTAAAAAGRLLVVALIGDAMRLSLLLVEGNAGEPHLRQRNRDTTRARLRASRQRSIRAGGASYL